MAESPSLIPTVSNVWLLSRGLPTSSDQSSQEAASRKRAYQQIRAFDCLQRNPWIYRFRSSILPPSGWAQPQPNPHYFNISRLRYQITDSYLERLLLRCFDCNLHDFWEGECCKMRYRAAVTIYILVGFWFTANVK